MRQRFRRRVATWAGVAALLCQILLPFGVAQFVGPTDGGGSLQAVSSAHYHDPRLVNVLGCDWRLGHSHAGDPPSGRVNVDHGCLTPFVAVNPPAEPMVLVRWLAYAADRTAPVHLAAVGFSRPLPRAPPPAA